MDPQAALAGGGYVELMSVFATVLANFVNAVGRNGKSNDKKKSSNESNTWKEQ